MGIPTADIQVISPTRRGECGTVQLNRALQAALNPAAPGKRQKVWGDLTFREGDRVMQNRNNYDVIWEKDDGDVGAGIFNGDVGLITEIDAEGQTLTIRFDDREAVYSFDLLPQIEPAFAMTVHKSQGSEYRAVVLCAWRGTPLLLSRSALSPAVTRARELLIVVGDREAVAYMVRNEKTQKRFSGLRWRLRRTAR
jgi:exodeoxyribonuclease V alpha subunit